MTEAKIQVGKGTWHAKHVDLLGGGANRLAKEKTPNLPIGWRVSARHYANLK